MTADGYRPGQSRPGGALTALLMTGTVLTGLILWSPDVVQRVDHGTLTIQPISVPRDPPPPDPQPRPQPHRRATIERPTVTPPDPQVPQLPTSADPQPYTPPSTGDPAGTGAGLSLGPPEAPPLPPPPLVTATIDPGSSLQPPYPPEEANAGREGLVTLRVHIGANGRVLAVEPVSATSDAFSRAAQRWAMSHWRFHPATRGGIPEDSWKLMRLRFELDEQAIRSWAG